jgi:K+-transporting ATPase A subunit
VLQAREHNTTPPAVVFTFGLAVESIKELWVHHLGWFIVIIYNHVIVFFFLKVVLKGSKQLKSKGCKTCEVGEGKVIIFRPNCYAYFIA